MIVGRTLSRLVCNVVMSSPLQGEMFISGRSPTARADPNRRISPPPVAKEAERRTPQGTNKFLARNRGKRGRRPPASPRLPAGHVAGARMPSPAENSRGRSMLNEVVTGLEHERRGCPVHRPTLRPRHRDGGCAHAVRQGALLCLRVRRGHRLSDEARTRGRDEKSGSAGGTRNFALLGGTNLVPGLLL
jgi:hypothetical protein